MGEVIYELLTDPEVVGQTDRYVIAHAVQQLTAERDAVRSLVVEYAEACKDVIAHLGEPGANERLQRHAFAHEALMKFEPNEAK